MFYQGDYYCFHTNVSDASVNMAVIDHIHPLHARGPYLQPSTKLSIGWTLRKTDWIICLELKC